MRRRGGCLGKRRRSASHDMCGVTSVSAVVPRTLARFGRPDLSLISWLPIWSHFATRAHPKVGAARLGRADAKEENRHSQSSEERVDVKSAVDEGGEGDGILHNVERRAESRALEAVSTAAGVSKDKMGARWVPRHGRSAGGAGGKSEGAGKTDHDAAENQPGGCRHGDSIFLQAPIRAPLAALVACNGEGDHSRDSVEQLLRREVGDDEPAKSA